jgi:hypothetical protein
MIGTELSPNKSLKDTQLRNAVAAQLREVRRVERDQLYSTSRNLEGYREALCGFTHLFDYARTVCQDGLVVDIGAGQTIGTAQIAFSTHGESLDFVATGLVRHPSVNKFLGVDRFKITSAEVMRGFDTASVSAIIAVFSAGYSISPEMVVRRFDQILKPGGIFKGVFRSISQTKECLEDKFLFNETKFSNPIPFLNEFRNYAFDTAVYDDGRCARLLTIKPGSHKSVKAQDLLEQDQIDHNSRNSHSGRNSLSDSTFLPSGSVKKASS